MNQRALGWLIALGFLVLATVAWLGFRLLEQMRAPVGGAPPVLAAAPQPSAAEAQMAVEALLALKLADLDGLMQPIAQWRGKVLVVNYWASWCAPCIEEMPAFSRLQEKYAAQGVQFVGIGIDEPAKMRAFVARTPVSYPLLVAEFGLGQQAGLQIKGLPYTLVVGKDGQLASSRLGRFDEAALEDILRRLVGK